MNEFTAVALNWRMPELSVRVAAALLRDGLAPKGLVIADNGFRNGSVYAIRVAAPGPVTVLEPPRTCSCAPFWDNMRGFDESSQMYAVDVDLAWRLKRRGIACGSPRPAPPSVPAAVL